MASAYQYVLPQTFAQRRVTVRVQEYNNCYPAVLSDLINYTIATMSPPGPLPADRLAYFAAYMYQYLVGKRSVCMAYGVVAYKAARAWLTGDSATSGLILPSEAEYANYCLRWLRDADPIDVAPSLLASTAL